MGSFLARGNQYIHLVKVLCCKLPTISKQQPTFPHKVQALNRRPQRWEGSVLSLCHRDPGFIWQLYWTAVVDVINMLMWHLVA